MVKGQLLFSISAAMESTWKRSGPAGRMELCQSLTWGEFTPAHASILDLGGLATP